MTNLPQSLAVLPAISPTSLAPPVPLAPFAEMAGGGGGLVSSFAGAVLSIRGGADAAADAAFDLTRARIRLEGLSAYGVVTALLMNAALRLLSSTPKTLKDVPPKGDEGGDADATHMRRVIRMENAATVAFAAASAVCILAAAYTTIVFSVLALYSKTALGMGADEKYQAFFEATDWYRWMGFESFIVSLLCFKTSMVMNLFLMYKGRLRWMVTGVSSAISLVTWLHLRDMLNLASTLLFK